MSADCSTNGQASVLAKISRSSHGRQRCNILRNLIFEGGLEYQYVIREQSTRRLQRSRPVTAIVDGGKVNGVARNTIPSILLRKIS